MVDFCNPGALGSPAEFRKRYEGPILAGEPAAPTAKLLLPADLAVWVVPTSTAVVKRHLHPLRMLGANDHLLLLSIEHDFRGVCVCV
jgi:hypothetical protein